MKMTGWFSRLSATQGRRIAGGAGAAILLVMTGMAAAQDPGMQSATPEMKVPAGYTVHQSEDLGGRIASVNGAGSMYDTLVNLQSGPRLLNQTFEMRALPGTVQGPFDVLNLTNSGYGGDPYDFSKLDFSKGNVYEFSGMFRRDRNYFDYDLLGNPNIPGGQSLAVANSTTGLPYSQINASPFFYNTVRRMTNIDLTLAPLSKFTYRFSYSQNVFEGPSFTPSGNSFAGSYEMILQEYQRNSGDNFMGGIDWKPVRNTRFTYEQEINRQKVDSYITLPANGFNVTEPDGTPALLLDTYANLSPVITCNTNSLNSNPTLWAPAMTGGMPIVNPACAVATNYMRSAPTRMLFPTEIFRLQSSTIKNLEMSGDVRYTDASMSLPNYYENFQGLEKNATQLIYTANASARREVMAADFGFVWQVNNRVSLGDQITFSNAHQPGTSMIVGLTTVATGTASGAETINSPATATASTPGTASIEGFSNVGAPLPNYFGQKQLQNDLTLSWNATSRSTFSLTYRHGEHDITQIASTDTKNGITVASWTPTLVNINEDGAVVNAALRPTNNWQINGSVEAMYNDNVLTPMGFRQLRQYRVHTLYRPKDWASISGTFNDRERHNNTNNAGVAAASGFGPLDHVDHSRFISMGADLFPNERYGIDLDYSYSDIYMADNTCVLGAATALANGGVVPGVAAANGSLCGAVTANTHGGGEVVLVGPVKDFEDAPTQFVSGALAVSLDTNLRANLGYRLSDVNGSRFFTDAGDVNGALSSMYQSPFVSLAWKFSPAWTWKAEYNYFGYSEGGQSGAQYCMDNPNLAVGTTNEAASVVPCSSVANAALSSATPTYGFTEPRAFRASNVVLGVHYEF